MKVEIRFAYEVTDPDPELEKHGTAIVEEVARELILRLHQRFADEGLDIERFENTREARLG